MFPVAHAWYYYSMQGIRSKLLLALLESEDSYVDQETMISKLKMHDG